MIEMGERCMCSSILGEPGIEEREHVSCHHNPLFYSEEDVAFVPERIFWKSQATAKRGWGRKGGASCIAMAKDQIKLRLKQLLILLI